MTFWPGIVAFGARDDSKIVTDLCSYALYML
jgi:hypothetical protein